MKNILRAMRNRVRQELMGEVGSQILEVKSDVAELKRDFLLKSLASPYFPT